MDKWIVSFITASFLSLIWPALPPPIFILLLSIVAFGCLPSTKFRPVSGFLFGCIWMASVGHWQLSWQLPLEQLRQVTQIQGRITTLVHDSESPVFIITTRQLNDRSLLIPSKVRLSWHKPDWPLKQGQNVRLSVKLKPNHGLANEGGFNHERWLVSKGVAATGYVKTADRQVLVKHGNSLRQRIRDRITEFGLVNEKWILALGIGDRSGLTGTDWKTIQQTGIAHLMAISGLHLGIVETFSYFIFSIVTGVVMLLLGSKSQRNMRRVGLIFSCVIAGFYAVLAGLELPVVRAAIAISMFTALTLWRCHWRMGQLLVLCVFLFVLCFPLSLYSLSFWLSFGAVCAIGFIVWRHAQSDFQFTLLNVVSGMVKVQLLLTLLMMPLIAWQFSLVSLLSPVVNLIAVPVVTIFLVPFCLISIFFILVNPPFGQALLLFLDESFTLFLPVLYELQTSQFGILTIKNIGWPAWFFMGLFVVFLVLPISYKRRCCAVILLLPLCSQMLDVKDEGWRLDVLDVGQGLAVLISQNGKVVLYDTGASFPSGFNMADAVILPLLTARGISHLDVIIVSHFDNDHAGSLDALKNGISIGNIVTPKDVCKKGWRMGWQNLHFEALWPEPGGALKGNNGSCVVRVFDGTNQVLLPGDIEGSAEQALVNTQGIKLASDVLVAPHHGSNTSSSTEFLAAVKPSISIFSQGFMNRWDFPPEKVVKRYLDVGSRLYSTSESGQISVFFTPNKDKSIQVMRYRQDRQHYWYIK